MFQLQDRNVLGDIISQIISYIPQLVGALIVLLVGWIVGRLLGRIVTMVLKKADIGRFVPSGEDDGRGDTDDGKGVGLSRGLGKLVKYYVYFIAVLAAAEILAIPMLTELLSDVGTYLPAIFGAVLILLLGLVVGRILEDIIADLISGFGFDLHLEGTPLERITGRRGIGGLIGQVVALYVYFIALLAAAGTLNITILSNLLNTITVYIPQLIGGAAVLLAGIWLGDWLGTQIAETDRKRLTDYVGLGVKAIVYYLVITMALQTAGFNASILNTLFVIAMTALFGSLALAFIIAAGVGGALGSKDYIADNIADWMREARRSASFEDEDSDMSGESGFEPPSD